MQTQIKDQIISKYKSLLNSHIDSTSLRFWEKQIMTGVNTFDDFIKEVLNSYEYSIFVTTKFKRIYYDIIDTNLSVQTIRHFQEICRNKEVNDKMVILHIHQLPEFYDKYTNIIKTVFQRVHDVSTSVIDENYDQEESNRAENTNENINSKTIEFYLKKFKESNQYDIDILFNDISCQLHVKELKDHENKINLTRYGTTNKNHLSNDHAMNFNSYVEDEEFNMEDESLGELQINKKDKNKEEHEHEHEQEENTDEKKHIELNRAEITEITEIDEIYENDDDVVDLSNTKTLNESEAKLRQFIIDNYTKKFNSTISNEDLQLTLDCFRDPSKIVIKYQQTEALQKNVHQLQSEIDDLTRYKNIVADVDSKCLHDVKSRYMGKSNTEVLIMNNKEIERYETVFKRPMFVHEYYKCILENYDTNNSSVNYSHVYNKFIDDYNNVRKIISDYLNYDLKEYDFVKKYLYAVENKAFFTKIIDDIVASNEYKKQMFSTIKQEFSSLFKETLKQHDIEYIFQKIVVHKLSLNDERLNEFLVDLKTETDDIISHIFTQYTNVLERSPDVYEIDDLVQHYRKNMIDCTIVEINTTTEKSLLLSLEFHDILKKKIKCVFPDIKPRVLFEKLGQLIKILPQETLLSVEKKIK
jgi:hypothetical protein